MEKLMEKVISALTKNPHLALVVIGLIFFLIAAAGGLDQYVHLHIQSLGWQITQAAIGILVAVFGGLLMWHAKSELDLKKQALAYEFRILNPTHGSVVDEHFTISGTWSKRKGELPSVVIIDQFTDNKKYLFKDAVMLLDNGTWSAENRYSPNGSSIFVHIAVVGKNGQVLEKYYHTAGEETGDWVGVSELPDDVVLCDKILVRVRPEPVLEENPEEDEAKEVRRRRK